MLFAVVRSTVAFIPLVERQGGIMVEKAKLAVVTVRMPIPPLVDGRGRGRGVRNGGLAQPIPHDTVLLGAAKTTWAGPTVTQPRAS